MRYLARQVPPSVIIGHDLPGFLTCTVNRRNDVDVQQMAPSGNDQKSVISRKQEGSSHSSHELPKYSKYGNTIAFSSGIHNPVAYVVHIRFRVEGGRRLLAHTKLIPNGKLPNITLSLLLIYKCIVCALGIGSFQLSAR
jgi:hypothetical protein